MIEPPPRADHFSHSELLELDPEGGVIHFAGQRAILLDAMAMGLLRQYLVQNFGLIAARAVLTQFGFAHGWRMAGAMQREFRWEDPDRLRRAGPQLHALEGLFQTQPGHDDPLSKRGATLLASYEAEQHILHFGRSEESACWTISGLMSGYISRAVGQEVYVLEDRCLAEGKAACHLVGRTREAWGQERADELAFFDPTRLSECLDVSLRRVTESLKVAEKKLRAHRRTSVHAEPEVVSPHGIIARSPAMQHAVELARRVARVDATFLITGESGVGKELIARFVHEESPRSSGPFVAVNCGAITETLLESELFGHKRGAFTGAYSDRPGLFEAAHLGTLLLDEIGDVSPAMQVKLLRVLQEREVRRVGENRGRAVDVRVLASTNRDLGREVERGAFRPDLYYRLRVIDLHLPPLRTRREDILPLARVLLANAARRMGRTVNTLSPGAADQLLQYHWPGNVRELENAMERAVALAQGSRVMVEDLPPEVRQAVPSPHPGGSEVRPLWAVEKDYILAVLARNDGNRARTAAQLGMGTATLYRRLKSYGMVDGRQRPA